MVHQIVPVGAGSAVFALLIATLFQWRAYGSHLVLVDIDSVH